MNMTFHEINHGVCAGYKARYSVTKEANMLRPILCPSAGFWV
jgi:hypothetical protein